jgi:hypothetical protein
MAIQKDTEFIGTIEHLIYYNWLGVYCIRMLPKKVRQTTGTKKAASNFGLVSSRSKIIRDLLKGLIVNPRDKGMQVRLKRALFKTLKPIEIPPLITEENPLLGFPFNESLPLREILRFPIETTEQPDGKIRIDIPAISPKDSITAPANTTEVQLALMTISFSFDHEQSFSGAPKILSIPFTNDLQPPTSIELQALTNRPCIILIIAALSYWEEDRRINPDGNKPVEIVAIFKETEAGNAS